LRAMSLIIMVSLLIPTALGAETTVKKISFTGGEPSSNINLFNRPGRPFVPDSLSADSLKIVASFSEQGWFDCQVIPIITENSSAWRSLPGQGVNIAFDIRKNRRYQLAIAPVDSAALMDFGNDIAAIIVLYEGDPATSANIDNLSNHIIDFYSDNGFAYCEVRISDIALADSNLLNIKLDIQSGPKVSIEKVQFAGRKNLSQAFLQTYSGLALPVAYSADRFAVVQKRLGNADFLSEADDFQLHYATSPEQGVVVFPIKEVFPFVIDGGLGYSSNDKTFYGRLAAVISNMLGSGRQAQLHWAKKDKSSRLLKIAYSEPNPFRAPVRVQLEAFQDDRDSLLIENGGSAGVHYQSYGIFSYGLTFGASQINPEPYGRTILPYKQRLKMTVSLSADRRDYKLNPLNGDYFYIDGTFVSEATRADSVFAASSINYRTIGLKAEKYFQVAKSSTIYTGLTGQAQNGQSDFSDNVPIDRLFPLGGYGSLRGYRQDIFYVSRAAVATVEYRLLTARANRAYIFADMALFQIPKAAPVDSTRQLPGDSRTEFKAGFGIGLAASTRLGFATIEIAAPHDEGLAAAKLHFGIRTGF